MAVKFRDGDSSMVQLRKNDKDVTPQLWLGMALLAYVALTSPVIAQQTDNGTNDEGAVSISQLAEQDAALDLTVLSTSEENVSFVVIEDSDNASDETQSQALMLQDNLTNVAEKPTDEDSQDTPQVDNNSLGDAQLAVADDSDNQSASTGRMTRVDVKDVGLASIGVGNQTIVTFDRLDNRLWRGVDLERALMLIEDAPVPTASVALRDMSYHVIARQGVPPKGAAQNPAALLTARLTYLAKAGRSDAIAAIISQLPKDDVWQEWHIWKLFYDLMRREDQDACAVAQEMASSSLDPLWQKTNLMCQILTGDSTRAAFSADVLKASGLIDDAFYFDLIDLLLGRKSAVDVPDQNVDLTHIILMDAAHVNISADHLAGLDSSYYEAANVLRYLTAEARQLLGLSNLRSGLTDQDQALALFVASAREDDTPLKAMSRRLEGTQDLSSDSASVQLYVALREQLSAATELSSDQALELAELIIQALRLEVADGQGALWLRFYAPLLSQAMRAVDMPNVSQQLQSDYASIATLSVQDLSPLPTDGRVVVNADVMRIALDQSADPKERLAALLRLELGHLAPLLESPTQAGFASDVDWLSVFRTANAKPAGSYARLSQEGLYALADSVQKGQRAEAVIISAMLLETVALSEVSPADVSYMAKLLDQANLPKTASALRAEVLLDAMMAHLFDQGETTF